MGKINGLLTCAVCNFSATALALAPDEQARGKTARALWQHLTRDHKYTIEKAQAAVEAMTPAEFKPQAMTAAQEHVEVEGMDKGADR